MNREEYIQKLVALARLKWHIDEVEQKELELLLDLIPDKAAPTRFNWDKILDTPPYTPGDKTPWGNESVLYGVQLPCENASNIFDKIKNEFVSDKANKCDDSKEAYTFAKDSSAISTSLQGDVSTTITHENAIKKNNGKKFYTNNNHKRNK